jgi:hypothetical protein
MRFVRDTNEVRSRYQPGGFTRLVGSPRMAGEVASRDPRARFAMPLGWVRMASEVASRCQWRGIAGRPGWQCQASRPASWHDPGGIAKPIGWRRKMIPMAWHGECAHLDAGSGGIANEGDWYREQTSVHSRCHLGGYVMPRGCSCDATSIKLRNQLTNEAMPPRRPCERGRPASRYQLGGIAIWVDWL